MQLGCTARNGGEGGWMAVLIRFCLVLVDRHQTASGLRRLGALN